MSSGMKVEKRGGEGDLVERENTGLYSEKEVNQRRIGFLQVGKAER